MVVNAGLLDGELNRIEGMEARFPNLVRVPDPNMVAEAAAPRSAALAVNLRGMRCLVVDDSPMSRDIFSKLLNGSINRYFRNG